MNATTDNPTSGQAPTVSFDWHDYLHHLDDHDLTQDQKAELIIIMAEIVAAFIDLGFGIAPGQITVDSTNEDKTLTDDFVLNCLIPNTQDDVPPRTEEAP